MDLYEIYVVIPAYKAGNRQLLIDHLKARKDDGKPLSQAILDLLIEIAERANLRKAGRREDLPRKLGMLELVHALSVVYPAMPKKEIHLLVAERFGLKKTKRIEKLVYPKKSSRRPPK